MMDKAYILENGILELYALGELTEKEQLEVETIITQNPELRTELRLIEETFENIAMDNSIKPPKVVKDQLLKNISASKTKVIPLKESRFSSLRIAASFAFIIMTIAGLWMMSELNSLKEELKLAEEEKTILINDLQKLGKNIEETNKWYNAINSPDAKKYVLVGNKLASNAKVISYVNDKEKTVIVNAINLPELDEEHDYQMWADVDGKMVNMGIIDKKSDMLAMTYIDYAESLNITIEPVGGNDHPTVSRLISNVYLNKS